MTSSQLTSAKEILTSELNSRLSAELPLSQRGTPTWELALDFPHQGEWTEEEYLSLDSNRMIEFSDGMLEFLPIPKPSHARISRFISDLLRGYVTRKNVGDVFWAPFSIRIGPTKLREPDIVYLSNERIPQNDVPPNGADLVVEVVSEGAENRFRDLNVKRSEYAAARIPEYWIVDPGSETITVLSLSNGSYANEREFRHGTIATSVLIAGFGVDVSAAFAAAKPPAK